MTSRKVAATKNTKKSEQSSVKIWLKSISKKLKKLLKFVLSRDLLPLLVMLLYLGVLIKTIVDVKGLHNSQRQADDFFNYYKRYSRATGGSSSSQDSNSGDYRRQYRPAKDVSLYYKLLGIPNNASPDVVRKAWIDGMLKYHPDKFATASPEERSAAERKAQEINNAFTAIKQSRPNDKWTKK